MTETTSKKFYSGVGKRKTAIAQVRIFDKGKGEYLVNDKAAEKYFPTEELQKIINQPLKLLTLENKFNISVKIKGGGPKSQAEAVRHGLARALENFDKELRKTLKVAGFLKRDARIKERKKPGLKRARRAPQWAKR